MSIDGLTRRTEETDPFCLTTSGAARLLAGAPWRRFVVVGDSLSAGIGDPSPGYQTGPWSARVAAALSLVHPDVVHVNLAGVGATTRDTLDDQLERALDLRPDLIHVPSGANDIWRRSPSFDTVARDLRHLFESAAGSGALVTTFTLGRAFVVPTIPDFAEHVLTLNEIIRSLAQDYGVVVIEMWDHPIMDRPDLLSADQIHFAASGQAVLAAEVVKALARALKERR